MLVHPYDPNVDGGVPVLSLLPPSIPPHSLGGQTSCLAQHIPPHPLSYHSCCQWNNNNNDKIVEMSDTVEGGYHFVASLVLMLKLVYVRSMRHV